MNRRGKGSYNWFFCDLCVCVFGVFQIVKNVIMGALILVILALRLVASTLFASLSCRSLEIIPWKFISWPHLSFSPIGCHYNLLKLKKTFGKTILGQVEMILVMPICRFQIKKLYYCRLVKILVPFWYKVITMIDASVE